MSDERAAIQCDTRDTLMAALRTRFPLSGYDAAILEELKECMDLGDDFEVDDDASISRSDNDDGTWVQAWVWVPDDPDDEDD